MPNIDFLPFATGAGANVENQASYASDPSTSAGFSSGIAQSQKLNKVWRQSSFISAGMAHLIANQLGQDVLDDGDLNGFVTKLTNALLALNPRTVLTGPTTYYVNSTIGSDNFNGLSPTTPWQTLQNAANYLMTSVDTNGQPVTVQVADGVYAGFQISTPILGEPGNPIVFLGNIANPANCVINAPPAVPPGGIAPGIGASNIITVTNLARITLQGFRIINSTANGHGIACALFGRVIFQNLDFGTITQPTGPPFAGAVTPSYAHIWATAWSRIRNQQNYSISGPAAFHVLADTHAQFANWGVSSTAASLITITNTPHFGGAFCAATQYGLVDWTGGLVAPLLTTFSGPATGVRWNVGFHGEVLTSNQGATFLPGDTAGVTDSTTYGLYH